MALSPAERSRRMRLNMLMAMSYAVAGRSTFTPASLFTGGVQGAWYDPSDLTSMFQDAAGTTAAALEAPVGLLLDKSKGLALGSEIAVNGGFDTDTVWTKGGTWAITGGQATFSGGAAANIQQTAVTSGKYYRVVVDVASITGTFSVRIGGGAFTATSSFYLTAGTNTATVLSDGVFIIIRSDGGTAIAVNSISVKEIAGNHASQSTSASRPVLSARVNLLTYSEQFDNAAWGATSVTVSTNQTTAPDGTTTADLCTDTSTTISIIGQSISTGVANAAYTASVSLKRGNIDWVRIQNDDGTANGGRVWVNLATGALGTQTTFGTATLGTVSISSEANGFYRVSVTATFASTTKRLAVNSATADNSGTRTTNGTYYIWGADLRVTNDGVGLPAYQRVGAATAGSSTAAGTADYDTTGFPYYLRFDGTDDSLATAAIDFSATDKMSLFAGVRKLSDAALSSIVELSASSGANNGAFALFGSNGAANYLWRSRGTASADAASGNNYAAPITNVVTGIADIGNDVSRIRVNAVQVGETLTDQGTGNFGSAYPLYIGSRAGSSQRYNGRLYSLIVRGAQSTATEITNAETWVNSKTKAY